MERLLEAACDWNGQEDEDGNQGKFQRVIKILENKEED